MRDTTKDEGNAQIINSSGLNNLAAVGGLGALIMAGVTVGVVRTFRLLKGFVARRT